MTIAQTNHIELALFRQLNTFEAKLAQGLLNHAENLIREQVPNLENICDADPHFARLVADIEAQVAARVIRGDGGVRLTETELAQLRRNRGARAHLPVYQNLRAGMLAA